jgi:hypothetical protein
MSLSSRSSHWLLALMLGIVLGVQPLCQANAQEEDEEPDYSVRLDLVTTTRLGIEVAPLSAAEFRGEIRGFGAVLAFDGLAQTDADLATAEAAVRASQAAVKTSEAAVETSKVALERARGLFAANVSVSRQTVEAAERQVATDMRQVDADMRQQAADAAQLALAQRKAVVSWGQNLPWRNAAERSQLLARLTAGDEVLARVTFSNGLTETPSSLKIERVAAGQGGAGWTANRIWSAPADPTVPGRSFFVLINGARGLLPGERLIASIPMGKVQQGVIIPSAAVLIAAGQGWYYQRETVMPVIPLAPFYVFNRKMLDLSQPTADGYFVPGGDPKQLVVVEGAGLILARETGTEEDED